MRRLSPMTPFSNAVVMHSAIQPISYFRIFLLEHSFEYLIEYSGAVLRWGRGQLPPNHRPVPNITWNTVGRKYQHIGAKMSVLLPSKIRQNAFLVGAPARTPLGSSRFSPNSLVGWEGTALPISNPTRFSRLWRSPRFGGGDIAPNILPNLPEYSTFPQHYCSNYKLKPYQYIN